jgi:hypothetical protein
VPSGARTHAKENINMNSIMVAPVCAPHQKKATDLVAAGIVGNTPTLRIGDARHHAGSGPDYSAALEGDNPGGLNDRAGLDMVRHARDRGDLLPVPPQTGRLSPNRPAVTAASQPLRDKEGISVVDIRDRDHGLHRHLGQLAPVDQMVATALLELDLDAAQRQSRRVGRLTNIMPHRKELAATKRANRSALNEIAASLGVSRSKLNRILEEPPLWPGERRLEVAERSGRKRW